ncbi:MAG: hypothetical protein PHH06_03835 [Candidatus Gracilibacteria bacterium]|nr:hypothetical protein [Candidatus Gracilibacteria bacterium]
MFNKILILLLTLLLSSCNTNHSDINKKVCNEENVNFINLDKTSLTNICNYKEKLKNIILKNNKLNIDDFYTLSKIDIDSGKYILGNIDNNISIIEKIQLYYILKNIHNYSDENIKNKLGFIDKEYKNFGISTERIVLAERLLTQIFEGDEETLYGVQKASGSLTYKDIVFLNIVFKFEPERFNNISLVADLTGGYNVLKDKKSRELYITIFKNLLPKLNNKQSKEIINNFLKNVKDNTNLGYNYSNGR